MLENGVSYKCTLAIILVLYSSLYYTIYAPFSITLTVSLIFPTISSQTTVCTANVHIVPLVGTFVQVTVVLVVVVGQLPQFDDRML